MPKEYKNPPVVEAWIDFRFEYGEESPEWDQRIVAEFIRKFEQFQREEYPALFKKEIKLNQDGSLASDRNVFVRLKAFNDENDRCLQVEQALLVYNMLRKKDVEWAGFAVLLDEAIPCCQAYVDFFSPLRVRPVLHYRDNIVIPFVDGRIEPKEYFEIYPEVPKDKFGDITDFALSLGLKEICRNGVGGFSARTQPIAATDANAKLPFVIDWNVQSVESFDCQKLEECREWLESAHEGIHAAFDRCLTEKCKLLFQE
jgi:uncharacterized protein (TIGR04255 family)